MMQYFKRLFNLQSQQQESELIMTTQKQEKPALAPVTHQQVIPAQTGSPWHAIYADANGPGSTVGCAVVGWIAVEQPGHAVRWVGLIVHPTHSDLMRADEYSVDFLGYSPPDDRSDWRPRALAYVKETYGIDEQKPDEQKPVHNWYDAFLPEIDPSLNQIGRR